MNRGVPPLCLAEMLMVVSEETGAEDLPKAAQFRSLKGILHEKFRVTHQQQGLLSVQLAKQ